MTCTAVIEQPAQVATQALWNYAMKHCCIKGLEQIEDKNLEFCYFINLQLEYLKFKADQTVYNV